MGGPACHREPRARCELSDEQRVGVSTGSSFDGIALANHARGALSVWSDPSGTWAQLAGTATRLAERCAGGVALADDGSAMGCLRPGDDENEGSALLSTLAGDLHTTRSIALGRVGRDARGIAMVRHQGALWVAWEDGLVGGPAVHLTRVAGERVEDRVLSLPGRNGRQPALLAANGRLYAVWSESDLIPGGESHRVMVARDAERPRALRQVQVGNPAPTLARDVDGLVLAYRDKRSGDLRPELYVARVGDDLKVRTRPERLGRANSEGGPALPLCGALRVAVVPLDHAGELYVAFHPLSAALRVLEDNHQFYASNREFVLATAVCAKDGLTALLAERTQPTKPGSELLKVAFRCTQ